MTSPGTPKPTTPLATFVTGKTTQGGVNRHMAKATLYGFLGFVGLCLAVALAVAFPPVILLYAPLGIWGVVRMLRRP